MEVIKEKHISGSLEPVSIKSTETILYQMKKCVCEIYIQGTKGTGYFTKIPYNNDLLSVLITNLQIIMYWEKKKLRMVKPFLYL